MSDITFYPKPAVLHSFPKTGHAYIQASAGTGKTHTIEHLILDLLITTELTLDEILVVTFTEKATTELRGRVREMLVKVLRYEGAPGEPAKSWCIDDRLRDKLERALFAFETAPIHTIHSFCRRVLTEQAFHNRQLFAQELVDGRTAFGRSFKKVLRRTFAREAKYKAMLEQVLEGGSVDALEDQLFACHRARAEFFPAWRPDGIAALADRLAELLDLDHMRDELARACVNVSWKGKAITLWEAVAGVLDTWRTRKDVLGFLGQVAVLPKLELILATPKPVKANAKEGKTLLYPDDFSPRNQELIRVLGQVADNMITPPAVVAQEFLPLVQAQLRADKQAEGFYDFDDMLLWVAEALHSTERGPALQAALRDQFRVALIDEFQDTDVTQWSIFRSIFMTPTHRLMVVGDPKQAIYGFRGGDFHTYLAAIKELEAQGAHPENLPENRRSTGRMIEAYNKVLDQNATSPFFSGQEVKYETPVCRGGGPLRTLDTDVEVPPIRLIAYSNAEASAGRMRQAIGRTIASEISRITTPGALRMHGDIAADDAAITFQDVFILTRSNREGIEISGYLAEAGIPYAFYKQDGLFTGEEATQIADLLAAIDDPTPSLRMRAFATPFFALEWDELERCREIDDSHALLQRLQAWKVLADSEKFGALFGQISEQSGLLRREILFSRGERRLTNYLHIFEILLETAQQRRCTLAELIQHLRDLINGTATTAGEDGGVQRLESERNAVKILTMHKSKGLQAKAVFLFGGFHNGNGGSKFSTVVHDAARNRLQVVGSLSWYPALKEAVQAEEDQENRRVLYVAMTRARALLYLPVIGELKVRPGGSYAPLNNRLRDLLPEIETSAELQTLFSVISVGDVQAPASSLHAAADSLAAWAPSDELLAERPARCDYSALLTSHAPIEIGSYSRMRGGHSRFLRPPKGDLPGGANTGNCLHEILEALPLETIGAETLFDEWKARPEIRQVFQRTLFRYAIDTNRFLERAQALVFQAVTTPLRAENVQIPALALCRRHPEMEFHIPIPLPAGATERGFIKGIIDLVFEHAGHIYFADWKSDTLRTYAADEMKARLDVDYYWQERLYTLGIVRLLEIKDAVTYDERFGGFFYVFLRGVQADGQGVLFRKPTWSQVETFEEEVARYYAGREGQELRHE